jgi:alpha-beta hydrolase superfamily lysophospholipase
MFRTAGWALVAVVALYGAICLLAFAFQRRLLYFPARYPERAALAAAARLGLSPWRDAAGVLAGWRAPPAGRPAARLLVLHGNAGSALDRLHYAAAFSRLGVEVVLLEYPGYGARPGRPALGSLGAAATAALDRLAQEGPEPVWVLGESLGSGVAARAVALRPGLVKGLVLVTPFARMTEVVRLHYPILPPALLLDRYAPELDLAAWEGPTAVLLAGRDEVVGLAQGRRLFDGLGGPKRLHLEERATHNGLDLDPAAPLWGEVVAFLARRG